MRNKAEIRITLVFIVIVVFLSSLPAVAGSPALPAAGSQLPTLKIEAASTEKDLRYLGLKAPQPFTVPQVEAPYVLIEIMSVYCPHCQAQAPLFNTLFNRIKKDSDLNGKLRMFAIAVGANNTEVEYMKKQYNITYPMLTDPEFKIHSMLGEPRTPFTIVAKKDMGVVYAHQGIIEDIDAFVLKLNELTK